MGICGPMSSPGGEYPCSHVPSRGMSTQVGWVLESEHSGGGGVLTPCYWHLVVATKTGGEYSCSHVPSWGDEYSGGVGTWGVSTQGVGTHPLLLTPSGGHQNMYGWQAGGTHPTGMLSCFKLKLQIHLLLYCQLHFNSLRMRLSPYKSCVYQTNLLKIPKKYLQTESFHGSFY